MKHIPIRKTDLFALVDDDDYERLSQWEWSLNNGYAVRSCLGKELRMHNEITHTPEGYQADHKNHNRLDNRKDNLRTATHSQNQWNKPKYHKINPSSQYKGVKFDKRRCTWCSEIQAHGQRIYVGTFVTEVDAALAYDRAAKVYHGDFAATNFDPGAFEGIEPMRHTPKHRDQNGEKHHMARLTEDDVREIRRLGESNISRAAIAHRFDISRGQVTKIILRQRWAHVQ